MTLLKSYNPATGELLAELPVTTSEQLQAKVQAAKQAQPAWAALQPSERKAHLMQAFASLTEQRESLAELIHQEMGKSVKDADIELSRALDNYEAYFDRILSAFEPEVITDDAVKSTLYYQPLGVCASISPWNFPVLMPHQLVVPALLAGNTVVLKPSEETTLIAKVYFEALAENLPKDVIQLVIGFGQQGAELVASDVQVIAFTGSKQTGSKILQSAGKDLKRVIMELGGKDPLIVRSDADIKAAAKFAALNSFRNAGQVCVGTERIYVMQDIAESFMQELKAVTKKIEMGPMIHAKQKAHVKKQVIEAIRQGAELVYGDPEKGEGNFLEPMILTHVNHDMGIMQDETFGPVACVMLVESEQQAIELANDSEFALGAVIFGENMDRNREIAKQLTAGMVGINKACGGAINTPWVGAKNSGYGYQSSKSGHRQFTQVRVVSEPV